MRRKIRRKKEKGKAEKNVDGRSRKGICDKRRRMRECKKM